MCYSLSAFAMLMSGWHSGGIKLLLGLLAWLIFISIIMGPYHFYRVLNRLTIWIPRAGEYGPNSEDWEWCVYSLIFGLLPILIFTYIAVA